MQRYEVQSGETLGDAFRVGSGESPQPSRAPSGPLVRHHDDWDGLSAVANLCK